MWWVVWWGQEGIGGMVSGRTANSPMVFGIDAMFWCVIVEERDGVVKTEDRALALDG